MRKIITCLTVNNTPSKPFVKRIWPSVAASLLACTLLGAGSTARADSPEARAIRSTQSYMNMLHAVVPERITFVINRIAEGSVHSYAPDQPLWIIEGETGAILYYQGQDAFKGAHASRLVDDEGFRFGAKALELLGKDRSGWMRVKLGGEIYQAYCDTRFPFAICSLVIPKK